MALLFQLLFIKPRMKGQNKLTSKTHKSLTISLQTLGSPRLAKRSWHYNTTTGTYDFM